MTTKIKHLLYGLTILAAVVILLDFALPGKIYTEDALRIDQNREQYYNAARNHHYSYKVITSSHQFFVSKDFAQSIQDEKISYSVSLLFKEINKYSALASQKNNIYSFRIVSGLVLPLIVILTIALAYFYKKKLHILIAVLQIILLSNLVYLIG